MNIKDTANAYEPKRMKTIVYLEIVRIDFEIRTEKFKEGTPDAYENYICTVDNVDYRVPDSVLAQLKEILKIKPDLTSFKVTSTGEGMLTKYTVIPL